LPSPTTVRALPPHEVRASGVGPYQLGDKLRSVLSRLPHGPRVELLQVEGLADYSLVRADDNKVVIGVENPGGVTFVTVLDSEIAHTDKEVGVGTSEKELRGKYSAELTQRNFAGDRRLFRAASLPGVRFFLAADRVAAMVVAQPPRPDVGAQACPTLEGEELGRIARIGAAPTIRRGCLGSTAPIAVVAKGERVAVVGGDGERPRRLAFATIRGLVFAAPIDVEGDGSDEILAVIKEQSRGKLTMTIEVFKVEGTKLSSLAKERVYTVENRAVIWAGARPESIELLLEAEARGGVVTVSGLLVEKGFMRLKEVFPLRPATMIVRPQGQGAGPPPAGGTVGRPDAGPRAPAVPVAPAKKP